MVVQIFVEVVQATLCQGTHATRLDLLGGDEAEQIKEMNALLNKRIARLERISVPGSNLVYINKEGNNF